MRLYNPTPLPTVTRLTGLREGSAVTVVSPGGKRTPASARIDLKGFGVAVLEIAAEPGSLDTTRRAQRR